MNKVCISITFLFVLVSGFSQTIPIKGKVFLYPANAPISGIYVIHNSKTVEGKTQNDGTFHLGLPLETKSPTQITINNKEYKIVNENTTNNISTTNKDPIEVFVGNRDSIDRQRINFYDINVKRIQQDYDKKIGVFEDSILNLEASKDQEITYLKSIVDSLKIEKEKNIAQISKLSEQLAELELELNLLKNDPNALSIGLIAISIDKYNTSFASFKRGEYVNALSEMINKEELHNLKELNEITFNRAKLNALIYTAMGDYENAIVWYKNICDYPLPENKADIERFFIYTHNAELEFRLKRYTEAEDDVTKALGKTVNEIYKIGAYNLYGNILKAKGVKNSECADKYKEAIKLYAKKKKEVGYIYLPIADKEAAISYKLLANHYYDTKAFSKAESNYLKALDIYISMAKNQEEYDEVNQINMLLRLASLYNSELRKKSLAKQCYDRVEVLFKATVIRPESKAAIYKEMGDFFLLSQEFETAIEKYNEALTIYLELDKLDKLDKKHPIIYEYDLMKIYFSIGMTYRYLKNYTESINSYKQAIEKLDGSSSKDKYRQFEGFLKASMGNSYKRNKEQDMANDYLNSAEKIANETNNDQLKEYIKSVRKSEKDFQFNALFQLLGAVATWGVYMLI
jgi:tetratricopeptide (TPR) repeat protein